MPHRYRLSPSGLQVAAGTPTLIVNTTNTGAPGHDPYWRTEDSIIFNPGDEHGTLELVVSSGETRLLHALELFELAAGGGRWAGVRASVGLFRDVAPNDPIQGAGQPAMADDGYLVFLVEDNRALADEDGVLARGGSLREPHCSTRLIAWWQDGEIWTLNRVTGERQKLVPRLPGEARPRCIDHNGTTALLTMTQTALMLRPQYDVPRAHVLELGNDQNWHSDCRPTADGWRLVANTHGGHPFDQAIPFDAPLVDLSAHTPQPTPQPQPVPEPEPQHMDISKYLVNRLDVVEAVKRDYPSLTGGAIVDQTAHRLNREHGLSGDAIVFGRKARNFDGSNPNDDALAIRRSMTDISQKAYVDLLVGDGHDTPRWGVIPENEEAGNGFWRPPVNADLDAVGGDQGDPGDEDDGDSDDEEENEDDGTAPDTATAPLLLRQIALQERQVELQEALLSEVSALRSAVGEQTAAIKSGVAELKQQVQAGVKIRF